MRFNVDLDTGSIDSTPNSGHASSHSKSKAKSDGLLTDPVADTEGERTLKLPRALVVSGLEHAGMPAQRALVDVLRDRRVVLDGTSNLSGRSKPDDDLDGVWNLPDGFILVYVCPWDPRERPAIHKTLVSGSVVADHSQSVYHLFI